MLPAEIEPPANPDAKTSLPVAKIAGHSGGARLRALRLFGRRHGWLVAIACAYLYVFPYFPKINSANELPRVYLVKAIVHEQTFAIDRGVARWGATADVSPFGRHKYSNKSPGSSLLAAPVYAAVNAVAGEPSLALSMWICRIVTGVIPTLAFLVLLYGFLARFAPDPAIRKLVVIAYALGSMAMTYSILYYSHQLGAVCVASTWILTLDVLDGKRGLRAMAVAGALAGAAPLVDYQAVFAAVPVAIYAVIRLRRDLPQLARVAGVGLIAAAVPIAILLVYHRVCFGSPWNTGYDASTTFAMYHQQGFLGITKLRWEAFTGSMVSPDNGLVTLAPWLLLAIPGAIKLLWRPRGPGVRGPAIVSVGVVLGYLLFISSINFWRGGWEVGPRYVTAMLPFLVPLVAAQLHAWREHPRILGAAAGTIVIGVAIYALSSATFPYWPDSIKNPLLDVTFHLLADNLVAPNLGSALGISGVAGILPYLGLVAGVTGWAIWRVAGWRGLVLAVAIGSIGLVGYCKFPRGTPERPYQFVRAAVIGTLGPTSR